MNKLIKNICNKNIHVQLVFTTCKTKNYFSTKDPLPSCFKSGVTYEFRCTSCYVGRTHTHNTRCKQHLVT